MTKRLLGLVVLVSLLVGTMQAMATEKCHWDSLSAVPGKITVNVACDGGIDTLSIFLNETLFGSSQKHGSSSMDSDWNSVDIKAGDDVCIVVNLWQYNRESLCQSVASLTPKVANLAPVVETNADCGKSPPQFAVNEVVQVPLAGSDAVLRTDPTTNYPSKIIGTIGVGGQVTVIAGPTCGESSAWYQVDAKGVVGWVAATYKGAVHLEKVKTS